MSEMVERMARKLEPQAWAALGTGDTLAYANRRTSSLRKARSVLEEMKNYRGEVEEALDRVPGGWGRGSWIAGIDAALGERT